MAHFIELTDRDNEKFLVNKDWIAKIKSSNDGTTAIYIGVPLIHGQQTNITSAFQIIHVKENYNILKDKLS